MPATMVLYMEFEMRDEEIKLQLPSERWRRTGLVVQRSLTRANLKHEASPIHVSCPDLCR
jgi:hypothetical protein